MQFASPPLPADPEDPMRVTDNTRPLGLVVGDTLILLHVLDQLPAL